MNRAQFDLALNWLRSQDPPLILPFGISPGEQPGGNAPTFTEETWNAYRWNPPGGIAYPPDAWDEDASDKPAWIELLAALGPAQLESAQRAALRELHDLCKRKITAAYGAGSVDEEMFLRLRNGETDAQNAERDRLRALYASQKAAIETAASPEVVAQLLTAALADSFWTPPPPDPPRRGG